MKNFSGKTLFLDRADIKLVLFDASLDHIDFPESLDLAIPVIDTQHPADRADGEGEDQGKNRER